MIMQIQIESTFWLNFPTRTGSVSEKVDEACKAAAATASTFQRIAGILDTIYHNPDKKTIPAIMQDYANSGEVIKIEAIGNNVRSYTLGLLTITEKD